MRLAITLLIALLLIAPAVAHTAAPPPFHQTRLLHDCTDDYYGGHNGGDKDGNELHALDFFEAYDSVLGNVGVFSLIYDGDGAGEIRLDLKAGGATRSYTWTAGSNGVFTGDFDAVRGQRDARDAGGSVDGTRQVVEGWVRLDELGGIGAKLTDYSVHSSYGGAEADNMPGFDSDGLLAECEDDYNPPINPTLRGPVQYASLSNDDGNIALAVGDEKIVQFTLKNKLADQAQTVTISADAGGAATAQMHNQNTDKYSDSLKLDINRKGQASDGAIVHVAVTGVSAGTTDVTVTMTTDKGGRLVQTFSATVSEDGSAPPAPSTPDPASPGEPEPEEESPGLPVMLMAMALCALAWVRRQ